jgi:hypothetical protein
VLTTSRSRKSDRSSINRCIKLATVASSVVAEVSLGSVK